MRLSIQERFWQKVNIIQDENSCWEWLAGIGSKGYGQFNIAGKTITASRVCWELVFGKIPIGLQVLHTCDNTICVRPKHLFLGTEADNAKDKSQKGRSTKGMKHGKREMVTIK